jgi:FKBP-type peptidyl-prolyl cis-trans isomerase SlyD
MGTSMPNTVRTNTVVSVTYIIRKQNGDVFEYSDLPVTYVHGAGGRLFRKIEQALEGRKAGDRVQVALAPEDGFGPHDPALTFTDDIDNVPEQFRHVGAQLSAQNAKGEELTFVVTHVGQDKLTVDANHPLAGQTVNFEVTVQDIREATPDEIRSGDPGAGTQRLQ